MRIRRLDKNIIFRLLFAGALLIAAGLLLAGCSPDTITEKKLREEGYVVAKFDCNGGMLSDRPYREFYTLPGSKLEKPGTRPSLPVPVLEGYDIEGWYLGEKDGDSGVVFGDKWDFDAKIYEDTVLYARWIKTLTVRYVNVTDGFEIAVDEVRLNEVFKLPGTINWEDHTFLGGFYASLEDFGEGLALDDSFTLIHDGTLSELAIYTEWVEGNYALVWKASDLTNIERDRNYYIMADELVFDDTVKWNMPAEFRGVIMGNGCTIRGIDFTVSYNLRSGTSLGLFGMLSGAKISDITFEDCRVQVSSSLQTSQVYAGFLAGRIAGNTTLDNVTVTSSCSVTLSGVEGYFEYCQDDAVFAGLTGYISSSADLLKCIFNIAPQVTITPPVYNQE